MTLTGQMLRCQPYTSHPPPVTYFSVFISQPYVTLIGAFWDITVMWYVLVLGADTAPFHHTYPSFVFFAKRLKSFAVYFDTDAVQENVMKPSSHVRVPSLTRSSSKHIRIEDQVQNWEYRRPLGDTLAYLIDSVIIF